MFFFFAFAFFPFGENHCQLDHLIVMVTFFFNFTLTFYFHYMLIGFGSFKIYLINTLAC